MDLQLPNGHVFGCLYIVKCLQLGNIQSPLSIEVLEDISRHMYASYQLQQSSRLAEQISLSSIVSYALFSDCSSIAARAFALDALCHSAFRSER